MKTINDIYINDITCENKTNFELTLVLLNWLLVLFVHLKLKLIVISSFK